MQQAEELVKLASASLQRSYTNRSRKSAQKAATEWSSPPSERLFGEPGGKKWLAWIEWDASQKSGYHFALFRFIPSPFDGCFVQFSVYDFDVLYLERFFIFIFSAPISLNHNTQSELFLAFVLKHLYWIELHSLESFGFCCWWFEASIGCISSILLPSPYERYMNLWCMSYQMLMLRALLHFKLSHIIFIWSSYARWIVLAVVFLLLLNISSTSYFQFRFECIWVFVRVHFLEYTGIWSDQGKTKRIVYKKKQLHWPS